MSSVTHPVDDDLLMGYAAGLLPQAHDLMVAAAVSMDDDARVRLSGFEALGGALLDGALDGAEVAPLRDDSFESVMDRITGTAMADTVAEGDKAPRGGAVLPQPLREAVGGDLDDVAWRPVGLGVQQAILGGDEAGTARLLRIPAGQAMPDHGHSGQEYTLVLRGAFVDGTDRFARGDLEVADAGIEHMPVADLGEDCICLVVTDAPLRFNGFLPRLAQRFLNI